MGTTETSQQTNAYNPSSMSTFNNLMSSLGNVLPGFMNNPFGTQQFKLGQQLGTNQANNLNQTATSGLTQNMTGSGMAGGASNPAATEMLQNQARAGTGTTANLGFIQPTQQALGTQQAALGTAAGFKPLQTGGTNVQSTQGLGTWLPQLLGGLGGAGMSALTGGLFGGGPTGGVPGMPGGGYQAGDTSVGSGALGNAGAGTPGGMPFGMAGMPTPPSLGGTNYGSGGGSFPGFGGQSGSNTTGFFGSAGAPQASGSSGGLQPWMTQPQA
jgi:hypothetical protein